MGSNNLAIWDAPINVSVIPFPIPIAVGLTPFGLTGLPIDYASGYFSAGVLVNCGFQAPI